MRTRPKICGKCQAKIGWEQDPTVLSEWAGGCECDPSRYVLHQWSIEDGYDYTNTSYN